MKTLLKIAVLAGLGAAVFFTQAAWLPYARPVARRLSAELAMALPKPQNTEPDPSLGGPSAASLSKPEGPTRRKVVTAGGDGPKTRMLSARGVSAEQEIRAAIGGHVVLAEEQKAPEPWEGQSRLLILGGLGLALLFIVVAWFQGSRSKTLA